MHGCEKDMTTAQSMPMCRDIRLSNEIKVVRVKGLEPPRLAAPEPKSGASTNSATPALNHKR